MPSSFANMLRGISSVCLFLSRIPKFTVAYKDPERVAQQLWKDPVAKIDEFIGAFKQLRVDLDTGTLQQNTIVTSKISEVIKVLGRHLDSSFHSRFSSDVLISFSPS